MNNTVELVGLYGDDLTHAQSAWTSTTRELTQEKLGRIDKLLNMLASEQHHTPFEKSMLHFLVTSDIATHIHMLKHRIGVSVNSESQRYRELTQDRYYIPNDWCQEEQEKLEKHIQRCYKEYHDCIKRLTKQHNVSRKRAKESARFYLPYGIQLTVDISFNFRSFVHFQKLRNSEHAQVEVRDVAEKMLQLVKDSNKFDLSIKAFNL